MKIVIVIGVILLSGCTHLFPHHEQLFSQDTLDFCYAFDVFQSTHKISELQQFAIDYPKSEWTPRAKTIVLYSLELDQRKDQVVSLREFRQQQADNLNEIKALNLQLTKQLEQFKGLLIRMEAQQQ